MKGGECEPVRGCRRELWLNRLSLAASAAASTGWGIRVRLRVADIKPTARHDILFSWAALTQTPLSAYYFLIPAEREVWVRKKLWTRRIPDVLKVLSLLIHLTLRLFLRRRIETFSLSQLLGFDWKKSLTLKCLQIKLKDDDCMCMQLYLSVSAWV